MVDTSGLTLVTQAAAARMLGVSRQAIGKAANTGRIKTYGPRKMVDASTLKAQLDATQSRVDLLRDDDPPPTAPIKNDASLTALKAKTEEERGILLRLEREEREGRLVPRDQVADEQEVAARLVKKALDAIPSRAEDIDAAAKQGGVLAVRKALKEIVRDVQASLAKALIEAADELEAQRAAEDDLDDAAA